MVNDLAFRIAGGGDGPYLYVRYLDHMTKSVVDIWWYVIEHLATAILEAGELKAKSVREVIAIATEPPPPPQVTRLKGKN